MKITEATYGRYRLRAGKMGEGFVARAFLAGSKGGQGTVAEAEGNTAEEALQRLQEALAQRDEGHRTSRRLIEGLQFQVPTVEEYAQAIPAAGLKTWELDMLSAHARAGANGLTPLEIAKAGGYNAIANANSLYGKVGRKIGDQIGIKGPRAPKSKEDGPTGILATYQSDPKGGDTEVWIMHPELREAMEARAADRGD
jgi:hypothetical protein